MPSKKNQIQILVRNLHGKMLQKIIVLSLFTFKELHEMEVQIKDAMKQGIILDEQEPHEEDLCSRFQCY
ncbi:hypothetical protein ACSBR1_012758 [Camellia fascicularis]